MAHRTIKSGYPELVGRLNRFPQGAPPSDVLYGILEMLFSEREAGLVALLPIKTFSVQEAAQRWKMVSANDPHRPNQRKAWLNEDLCLGCGVCVSVCPSQGLRLESRPERVITPLDSTHRTVVMAIERGGLQDLIFDNRALASHRAMAAILGVILKLPPIKRSLASQQIKSRYLESLLSWGKQRYSPP